MSIINGAFQKQFHAYAANKSALDFLYRVATIELILQRNVDVLWKDLLLLAGFDKNDTSWFKYKNTPVLKILSALLQLLHWHIRILNMSLQQQLDI